MRTAHRDTDSPRPKARGNVIGMKSAGRMKGNSNHIRGHVPVDILGFLIDVNHIPMPGNSGGQIGHGNLLKIEDPRPSHLSNLRRRGGYQQKSRHEQFSKPNFNGTQNLTRRHTSPGDFPLAPIFSASSFLPSFLPLSYSASPRRSLPVEGV